MIRANAAAWQDVLRAANVADRPAPGKWSPLEYGCHVRDVLRLYDYRLTLMLTQDDPLYPNWDQDETAIADRYGEQDPATVAAGLAEAAETIAGRFAAVTGDQWPRKGRRSDGAQFTIETFAQLLHPRPGAPPLRRHRSTARSRLTPPCSPSCSGVPG